MQERTVIAREGTREALLASARELFLKNTYSNISIRKIANHANVNSAMIAYYFGSKSGLFREAIKSFLDVNFRLTNEAISKPLIRESLSDFFIRFYSKMPPELIQLVIRTLIYERGETRDWLLDHLMKPALKLAEQLSQSIIDGSGRDIEPIVLRTVLQSLIVFPKLIQPVLKELHPTEIDDAFYRQLADLNAHLIGEYFQVKAHQ